MARPISELPYYVYNQTVTQLQRTHIHTDCRCQFISSSPLNSFYTKDFFQATYHTSMDKGVVKRTHSHKNTTIS